MVTISELGYLSIELLANIILIGLVIIIFFWLKGKFDKKYTLVFNLEKNKRK